jgi:hypothetical protein
MVLITAPLVSGRARYCYSAGERPRFASARGDLNAQGFRSESDFCRRRLGPPAGTANFEMRLIDEVLQRLSHPTVKALIEQEFAFADNFLAVVLYE